ncbi:MAG: MFS transporter [Candidatus Aenigmatarchaeota archaeon]
MPKPKRGLHKTKRNILRDAASGGTFDGLFPNYVTPFALALGAGNELIGIINAIPEFASRMFQWFEGKFLERIKSKRKAVMYFSLLARLMLLPMILIPFLFPSIGIWILMISLAFYAFFRGFASTGWSSWVPELIPEKEWGRFFGDRKMILIAFSLVAMLFAGWLLGRIEDPYGFSVLFALALIPAFLVFYFLSKIPELKIKHRSKKMTFVGFVKSLRKYKYFKNFVAYRTGLLFSAYLIGPFIIVYMLRDLGIGYEWFAIALGVKMLVSIISQPYWGRMADRYGDRTMIYICSTMAIALPLLWIFVSGPSEIILIMIFDGFVWAGLELTCFNYLIEVIPHSHKPIYIGNYKMFVGFSLITAPLLGGFLAEWLATQSFLWLTGLPLLFLLAFVLRAVLTIPFLAKFKEVRIRKTPSVRRIFWQVVAIKPFKGIIHGIEHAPHYVHYYERKFAKVVK